MQPLVIADAQPHIVGVLNRRKIEVFAPDKGAHRGEEPCSRLAVAGAGPRLDIGGPLPCAADAFVIALGRPHRDANRRHRRVGAQAQVGAEDIALAGQVRQEPRHPPRDAHERGAGIVIAVVVETALVEEHDEVDVGGIVQLPCPHLAHREGDHAACGLGVLRRKTGDLAAGNLSFDKAAQAGIDRGIGKIGERLCDCLERPDTAEIGEPCQKGHPPFGLPQTVRELVERHLGRAGDHGRERHVRII